MPAYHSTQAVPQYPNLSPLKKKVEFRKLKDRMFGKLKFFSAAKSYGFIVQDSDGTDLFVHHDDLRKAQVSDDLL